MASPNKTRLDYLRLIAGCLTPSTLAAVIADLDDAGPGIAQEDDCQKPVLHRWTRRLLSEQLADLIGEEAAAEAIDGERRANEAADGRDPRLHAGPSEADIAQGIEIVKRRFSRELSPAAAARADRCNPNEADTPLGDTVADGCPKCGENLCDRLVWIDDDIVRCASCGTQYQPA